MQGHEVIAMSQNQVKKILRIDSSARYSDSVTRRLGNEVVRRLRQAHPGADLTERDLSGDIGFLTEGWVQASMANPGERDQAQAKLLADSDLLVGELDAADVIVLTAPVYNFSVPAALKAWVDKVCRARLTFKYTENGPQGLLKDRPVYLVMASGGVAFGSPADFASGYLRHVFGFIGIRDVRLVYAERTSADAASSENAALDMLSQWLPGRAASAVA
jgi:FMN-dependent NADH-azoreductase